MSQHFEQEWLFRGIEKPSTKSQKCCCLRQSYFLGNVNWAGDKKTCER